MYGQTAGRKMENSENISELVAKLKILVAEKYKDLRLPPDGDNLLERSLRHRKFDLNQAADQVHSFFKLFLELSKKRGSENIFLPSSHRQYFLDTFAVSILKRSNLKEQPVLLVNFEVMPGETFCPEKGCAVFTLMLNEVTRQCVDAQRMGVVAVVNLKGFQFAHAKTFSLSAVRISAKVIQGAVPVSIKALHFINVPSIFSYTYALLSLFLRQKIKDRIHFHGSDLTEYYKTLPPNTIPIAFGGHLSNEECLDTEFIKELYEKDDYYKDFLRYGYTSHVDQES